MSERDGRQPAGDGDPDFERLLRNKTVAVVGPARTLSGTKRGRVIDAFDLVVRFNDAFEHLRASADLDEDIGRRADIIYCNQAILRTHILEQPAASRARVLRTCEEAGVRYFVCTNNSLSYTATGAAETDCDRQDRRVLTDVAGVLDQHGAGMTLRVVRAASETLSAWLDGYWGRTGFVALWDLLSYDVRRLSVTGMTLYHGGGHLFSSHARELHPLKNRDGTWARSPSGRGHDSYRERDLMRLWVRWFRHRLDVDDDLMQILDRTDGA